MTTTWAPITVYKSLTSAEQRQHDAEVGSYTHHQTSDHPPTAHTKGRSPHTNTANTPQHVKIMAQQCGQAESRMRMANSASEGKTTVQLKTHPTHLQCTAIRTLQQLAPTAMVRIPADRQAQQQSGEAHHILPAHKKFVNRALSPITEVQILMHTACDAFSLLMQVLHCVLCTLNMALCTLIPLLSTSTWLFISVFTTAVSIHTTVFENRQPSKCVQSPQVMQACVILVSLLSKSANLTMFIFTQVHCMLTLAVANSSLARPHWNNVCLIMLYAPKAIDKLTTRLAHVVEFAIRSLVKHPKQSKLSHPRIRNGKYWRRIKNRTRRLHKQHVYRYIKVLCWLHHFMQQSTPQQPECSKEHTSQPEH